MIKIILVEDHNIVRDGLRSLLESEADFEVVAEAKNGAEVLSMLQGGLQADVLLTDMSMPVMGGMELLDEVKNHYPGLRVVVLSAHDHEKYVLQSFKSGAMGYVLKSVSADELVFAIKHVSAGFQYICSEFTVRFLNRILSVPEPVINEQSQDVGFTDREIQVLAYLADGMTNQEIASKLFTSKRTVEGYRENMISRTGVRNTVALIRYAVSNGIIN
jgi:DNA-binding NarL/FixJ family response regulator